MAMTSPDPFPIDTPPQTARHGERRQRLQEARDFRLEQLARLEQELADAPRQSVKRALHMAATTALTEIHAAIDRMDRGVYGLCVTCGGAIDDERLDVLPMAAQCMPCHFNEQNCRRAGGR